MLDKIQLTAAIPRALAEIEANNVDDTSIYEEELAQQTLLRDESLMRRHMMARNLLRRVGIQIADLPNERKYLDRKPFRLALRGLIEVGIIDVDYEQLAGLPVYRETFSTHSPED
jgi:arsenate reductase-like glutaredoxin family protein